MASIPVFSIRPKAQLGQSMQPFENIIQQEKPIRFLLSSLQVSWHKTKQCSVFLIAVCTPKSFVSVCGDGMPRTVYLTECNRLLLVLLTLCVCLCVYAQKRWSFDGITREDANVLERVYYLRALWLWRSNCGPPLLWPSLHRWQHRIRI